MPRPNSGLRKLVIVFTVGLLLLVVLGVVTAGKGSEKGELKVASKITAKLSEEIAKAGAEELPVIILLKKGDTPTEKIQLQSTVASTVEAKGGKVKYKYRLINAIAAKVPVSKITELARLDEVEKIFYDEVLFIPPTPQVRAETSLENATKSIGADYAWNLGYDGTGVTIAVIDTGINYTHPDLGGGFGAGYKVVGGYDFVNNDDNPMDDNGHGTHVAGTIAANGSIKGVAPNATLLAVKVLGADGGGYLSDVIAGVDWSVANGADIISMSLGGFSLPNDGNNPLSLAVDAAVDRGVVVVVAAGNEGPGTGTVSRPGDAKKAITVGAANTNGTITISDDVVAEFSSRGASAFGRLDPDVVAPGVAINSTSANGGYETKSGTSMAAPFVSGAAALLLQKDPSLTPEQVRAILMHTASSIGGHVFEQGAGLINLTNALTYNISTSINGNDRWEVSVMPGLSATATLTLNNDNDYVVNFSFTLEQITDLEGDKSLPQSSFSLPSYVVVPPKSSRSVKITFTAPTNAEPAIYGTTLIISGYSAVLRVPIVITIPLLGNGTINGSVDDGAIYGGDWIYYKVKAYNGTSLYAKLEWGNTTNDLNLYLLAPNGELVDRSESGNGTYEEVSLADMVYDEYWLAVHAYYLSTTQEMYTIIVSYPPTSQGTLQVSPSSWQGSVKSYEVKNITFTITNDNVPKTVNLSVNVLSPGSSDFLTCTVENTGGSYLIVWNVTSSGIDVANAKYLNITLQWDNSSSDLDLALFYWNGSAWVKTRFESAHNNVQLGEAIEELKSVDVRHYLKTYPDFGIGIANWGASQTYNLTVNFTDLLPWDAANVNVTSLTLNANDVKYVNVSIDGSKLIPGKEYEAVFLINNETEDFATVWLYVYALPTPVHDVNTGKNFTTIQEAINDPETIDGHTITIDPGEYVENVFVNKSITIIGNGPKESIIIKANDLNSSVIYIENASNARLDNLVLQEGRCGISLYNVSNFTISNVKAVNNIYGILLTSSSNNTINDSVISQNDYGIALINSSYNTIKVNEILNNDKGFYLNNSSSNLIYLNYFNNTNNTYNEKSINTWNTTVGNYWGDYLGTDSDGDRIGDVPYEIDSYNADYKPLLVKPQDPPYIAASYTPIVDQTMTTNLTLRVLEFWPSMLVVYENDSVVYSNGYGCYEPIEIPINTTKPAVITYRILANDTRNNSAEKTLTVCVMPTPEETNETQVTLQQNNATEIDLGNLTVEINSTSSVSGNVSVRFYNSSPIASLSGKNAVIYFAINVDDVINSNVSSVTIYYHYSDSDIAGLNESSLRVYYYNETSTRWEQLEGGVNRTGKYVWGNTTHFSLFAAFAEPKPDLTVESISTPSSMTAGNTYSIGVAVANLGGSASNIRVTLKADGAVVGNQTIASLNAGETKTVTFSWTPSAGSHTLTAIVDPDNNIDELNEGNNTKSIAVNVQSPSTSGGVSGGAGGGGGGGGGAGAPSYKIGSITISAPSSVKAGETFNISVSFTTNFRTSGAKITAVVPRGWSATSLTIDVDYGGKGNITVSVPENATTGKYTITVKVDARYDAKQRNVTIKVISSYGREKGETTAPPVSIKYTKTNKTAQPTAQTPSTPTSEITPTPEITKEAQTPESKIPGFEALLALTIIAAVAILRRRQYR